MFTKKEIIVTVIFIISFAVLIYFLPSLEGNMFNRNNHQYKEEPKQKEIDKYVCTFSSSNNILKTIVEATFYINGNDVTRIYTRESKTYTKKTDYDAAIRSLEKNIETEDLEIKTTLDDLNYTIITVTGQNIKENIKVKFPIKHSELTEYLEENKYTCTIRYKK